MLLKITTDKNLLDENSVGFIFSDQKGVLSYPEKEDLKFEKKNWDELEHKPNYVLSGDSAVETFAKLDIPTGVIIPSNPKHIGRVPFRSLDWLTTAELPNAMEVENIGIYKWYQGHDFENDSLYTIPTENGRWKASVLMTNQIRSKFRTRTIRLTLTSSIGVYTTTDAIPAGNSYLVDFPIKEGETPFLLFNQKGQQLAYSSSFPNKETCRLAIYPTISDRFTKTHYSGSTYYYVHYFENSFTLLVKK